MRGRSPSGCADDKFSSILSRYEGRVQPGGAASYWDGERTFRRWRQRFEDEGEAGCLIGGW